MPSPLPLYTDPSYRDFFIESYHYFVRNVKSLYSQNYFREKFQEDLKLMIQQITAIDLLVIVTLTVALTLGRHMASKYIFMPIAKWRGIGKNEIDKIPESAWKLLFYASTWTSTTYYLFFHQKTQYLQNPSTVWEDYSIHAPVSRFIYIIYMVELSFYIHSLYTTILVDQRRKDTYTLLFHHLICIVLISLSYCNKSHKSGLLMLFLHDSSDVLLEATKLVRYFKVQHGRTYNGVEVFVNIGFASFLLTWVSNRLYWFPIKQVYINSVYVESMKIHVPFSTLVVTLLWIILVMNFYWFTFAVRLLYKVATGQIKELEDNREYKQRNEDANGELMVKRTTITCTDNAGDDERRKFSVDSGVEMVGDVDEIEMNTDAEINQTALKPTSASTSYNLRQRKALDTRQQLSLGMSPPNQ